VISIVATDADTVDFVKILKKPSSTGL